MLKKPERLTFYFIGVRCRAYQKETVGGQARFPQDGYVWDFNYRGSLGFLHQAETEKTQKRLFVEDGWTYFINGWAVVMGEVFDREITEEDIANLSAVAEAVRKKHND